MTPARSLPRPLRLPWTPLYWTLTAIGAAYCAAVLLGVAPLGGYSGPVTMCDGAAYYYADPNHPYDWARLGIGVQEYRYAPAFLWALAPLRVLPWELYVAVWFGLHIAAFVWLRAGWMLAVPGLNEDVIRGNINVFLAVAVVLALTRSASWWMPVLLTKVTPGVGLVWHVARREWRSVLVAVGVTLAVVALGSLIAQGQWIEWGRSLLIGPETYEVGHPLGPLALRLGLAAALTLYAGWSDREWLVPVAMLVAMPGLWPAAFALLAAVPRLRQSPSPSSSC